MHDIYLTELAQIMESGRFVAQVDTCIKEVKIITERNISPTEILTFRQSERVLFSLPCQPLKNEWFKLDCNNIVLAKGESITIAFPEPHIVYLSMTCYREKDKL